MYRDRTDLELKPKDKFEQMHYSDFISCMWPDLALTCLTKTLFYFILIHIIEYLAGYGLAQLIRTCFTGLATIILLLLFYYYY